MTARIGRVPLLALAIMSMAWGIWLGLLRLGWALPLPWPDQLILHGPLMVGGFLGTLVGLERAIGLARPRGVAGVLLLVTTANAPGPTYDAILHAIFIGFVVSMIFGHAPIVSPAVTGMPLPYHPVSYLSLVVLQASVLLRLTGDLVDALGRLRAWGGLLNMIAIILFILTTARLVAGGRSSRRASP